MRKSKFSILVISFVFVFVALASMLLQPSLVLADNAPCAPGVPSVWAPSAKDFLGTSVSDKSKVYFTGAEGILTEVFYPTVDNVQNVDLQFLVTDANKTWGDEERKQKHDIVQVNKRAMVWQTTTTDNDGRWKITKKFFTDPTRPTVIQRVTFETLEPGKTVKDYNVYLLNNPAINNTGSGSPTKCTPSASKGGDNSRTLSSGNGLRSTGGERTFLVASEPSLTSSALTTSLPWKNVGGSQMVSNGFVGQNDGFTDLLGSKDQTMDWHYEGAFGGNVAQIGWLDFGDSSASKISFDVVLGFGENESAAMDVANATLNSDLATLETEYTNGWIGYTKKLKNLEKWAADDQSYLAAMTLKSIQDKSNGAMIAGLGTPWGETNGDNNQGGYHLVWPRDLFKFASSLIAAGDTDSANQAVDYLFTKQMEQNDPNGQNGRFPQNSYVDGSIYWNGTQMDQTAMPIILAWKLNRTDLWPKIKLAAEYLAKNGPYTDQERWEEMAGYSPSTIAAEISGLVCAADLAKKANDTETASFYLKKADEWRNNVANWTFTTTGFHGNGKYYIRITANQDPNDDVQLQFKNGTGTNGERYIIDGGFLELVRLGAMSPNDWTILETIPEYDTILKQTLSMKDGKTADAWFRYNYDGYGEYNDGRNFDKSGRGRLWPIFTAERGIYEVAKSGKGSVGQPYVASLKSFSSETGFIPEQVWNKSTNLTGWETTTPAGSIPGTATRSIQPLSWAMGEYINLIEAINSNKSDAPDVVCERYACNKPQTDVTFNVNATTKPGENIYLVGNNPLLSNWEPSSGIKLSPSAYPNWSVKVSLPASTSFEYNFVKRDGNGNTIWEDGQKHTFQTPANGSITRDDTFK